MIYTVTFNPSLDYVMFVPQLQLGGISRATHENIYPGGKGINVAIVLERLGRPCTALGFIAGHTGKAICSLLQGQLSCVDFVELTNGENRINVKIKSTVESDVNGCGPQVPVEKLQELLTKLDHLKTGDILILSGAVSPGVTKDVYGQILQRLQNRGVLCVVDAVGELLKNALAYKPFLIKPNVAELADLFHTAIQTEEEIIAYARQAQAAGAQNVLVSRGAEGALLLAENGVILRAPAVHLKSPVVNSVGAGDSMVAGFLAGWLPGHNYQTALQWAVAAGGACVTKEWLPEKNEILTYISPSTQAETEEQK